MAASALPCGAGPYPSGAAGNLCNEGTKDGGVKRDQVEYKGGTMRGLLLSCVEITLQMAVVL